MSYLAHEPDLENCGCPSCDLMDNYNKDYEIYKGRKAYRIVEVEKSQDSQKHEIELSLNQMQERGYEMTAVVENLIVLRSVPPMPPTNSDVIGEYTRRKEKIDKREIGENFNIKDDEDFGPTLGGKQ